MILKFRQNISGPVTYIPMGNVKEYAVIVALATPKGSRPDLLNLSAFRAQAGQCVHVKQGVWHHVISIGEFSVKFHGELSVVDGRGDFLVVQPEQESRQSTLKPNVIYIEN